MPGRWRTIGMEMAARHWLGRLVSLHGCQLNHLLIKT